MKIDVGKQAMNGREEDFEWIEFYASAFQIGSTAARSAMRRATEKPMARK